LASEFELIAKHFTRQARHTELGVGDDGALIRTSANCELVVSTDLLVEGTHFFSNVEPESLGWKTLAVNLSDMAAMGATPRWATLACVLNGVSPAPTGEFANSSEDEWLAAFARGFFACADRYGVDLVGGDTTRGRQGATTFSVTIFGEVPRGQALRRSGAQIGDDIWVSGKLGQAALGLAHLQGRARLAEGQLATCLEALHRPIPKIELGLALRSLASAAIDVSDGLLADLTHLLAASKVSAELRIPNLPDNDLAREAYLTGGDDYELVFTAEVERVSEILAIGERLGVLLQKIGVVNTDTSKRLIVINQAGMDITPERRGFDHFR